METPGTLSTGFIGRKGPLFGLALRTGLLTVLTLGIYRFWMKTRLRRYYWSSVRPGGVPLEYVGQPIEKLLGFLIAVVILAFYIGVVNLVLMFASLSLFEGASPAYLLSFLGVIPLWFYASYRARRYRLARTRWRGIRFALDPGAWGYAWRAMAHWLVTILSLGLLWPRMTFWLEKYRTDRTWFGDVQLHQGGSWRMLYAAALPLIISVAASTVAALAAYQGRMGLLWILAVTVPLFLFGLVYYRVRSLALLTNTKSAGGITLTAAPRTGRVLGIHLGGNIVISILIGLVLSALFAVIGGLVAAMAGATGTLTSIEALPDAVMSVGIGAGVAAYFLVFLSWSVLRHVFITLPLWQHYAETLSVHGVGAIDAVRQRQRDEHTEAEGFAEALDLGAAI